MRGQIPEIQTGLSKPIAALFMIVFLFCCLCLSLSTVIFNAQALLKTPKENSAIYNGHWASLFEDDFAENLIFRDAITGFWRAIQYGVLKSGGDKALAGQHGWLYTTEEFKIEANAEHAKQRFFALLPKINTYLQSHNIKLAVLYVPAKARIYPENLGRHSLPEDREKLYEELIYTTRKKGIIAPDLLSQYQNQKDETLLYFPLDTHWTPEGAFIAAKNIADTVRDIPLKTTEFTRQKTGIYTLDADLEKYIDTGIFNPVLAPDKNQITQYIVQKESDGSAGLFGDEVIPVALIGTSYSAIKAWNFEGALKYALQADVLNLADEGQGPLAPMADFLSKTNFKNTDLQLVIWEVPERFVPVSYPEITFPPFIEGEK